LSVQRAKYPTTTASAGDVGEEIEVGSVRRCPAPRASLSCPYHLAQEGIQNGIGVKTDWLVPPDPPFIAALSPLM